MAFRLPVWVRSHRPGWTIRWPKKVCQLDVGHGIDALEYLSYLPYDFIRTA